jgi:glycosyltransferase involved in cell wall biosynthesis
VDCERFFPVASISAARQAVGLPQDAIVLGSVGRFIATKRYPLLIEAFESLAAEIPNLHLMILGDGGADKAEIEERIRQSPMQKRIWPLGHKDEPAPFYQAMDLMVMPSSHEGLANALLEAMASGVPVLAHAACGANEVISDGETGFLADISNGRDLANQIGGLLKQPEHLKIVGKAARAEALQRFSLARMMECYSTVYQACRRAESITESAKCSPREKSPMR